VPQTLLVAADDDGLRLLIVGGAFVAGLHGAGPMFEYASPHPPPVTRPRDERHVPHLIELVVRREHDAATVEGAERRAMPDGDDRRAFETLQQQPIKRRFGGFVERSR